MSGNLQKIVVLCLVLLVAVVVWLLFFGTAPVAEAPVVDNAQGTADTSGRDTATPTTPVDDSINSGSSKSISSFEECVAAGNPVMESYPRQCRAQGTLFVEDVSSIPGDPSVTVCTPESKQVEVCTMEYAPVCGLVEVQCITAPCDPVPETFSSGCMACAQGNVVTYTQGACEV